MSFNPSVFLYGIEPSAMAAAASVAERSVSDGLHSDVIVGILLVLAFVLILIIALLVLIVVAAWKIYVKAGVPGWASLVPFYGTVKLLEITNYPLWWVVLMLIPFVGIVFWIMLLHRLALAFGKDIAFTLGLIFLPFIFFPILGFGSARYSNTFPPRKQMSEAVRWSLIGAAAYLAMLAFFAIFSLGAAKQPLAVVSGGGEYATDGTYVYYYDKLIPEADSTTFRAVGEDYALDQSAVYFDGTVVPDADPQSFSLFSGSSYAKDSTRVYYDGEALDGADPASFEVLEGSEEYAKDASRVYEYGQPIDGADAGTFVVIGNGYAKDASHVYYDQDQVTGADPKTFESASDPSGNDAYDARDKNHRYLEGVVAK